MPKKRRIVFNEVSSPITDFGNQTMFMCVLSVIVLTLIVGCGNGKPKTPPADDKNQKPRAEIRLGGSDEDHSKNLPFRIISIAEKQSLGMEFPFHADGGDWMFFDCEAGTDSKAVFTVGVMSRKGAGNIPSAWGRAVLAVRDQKAGGQFLELFGRSFPGKIPIPVKRTYSPEPLLINTAILGENMSREEFGSFQGDGGGWTATKWFPGHDGRDAEVYFNYNVAQRKGEFSEKDAEYADDLLAIWASALRDGPRPERTPENDPNLTLKGPAIGQSRKLLPRRASHYSFSSTGRFAVYQDRTEIFAIPLDGSDNSPVEIARFEHSPWEMRVLNEDLDLVVQEGVAESPGVKSSADPMRIWWIDQKKAEKKLLRGPEKEFGLEEAAISPDLRFVALHQWKTAPDRNRSKSIIVLDRVSGHEKIVELPKGTLSLVGWKTTEEGLRAVGLTNRWGFEKNEPSESYLLDPATGKLERQVNDSPRADIDDRLSPDEKNRVRVSKDELIVTDVTDGSQRLFVFHEDDQQFIGDEAIEWVSPRYLKFNGQRLALIDVTTMKMSFPPLADKTKFGSHSYHFSPDFRWVMYQGESVDGEGLFLAPVEIRDEQ